MGAGVSEAFIKGAASTPFTAEALIIFTTADSVATTTVLITTMADITAITIMAAITATPTTTADTMATPGMEDSVSALVSARSWGLGATPTVMGIILRRTRITRMALTGAVLPTLRMIGTIRPTHRIKTASLVTQAQTNLAGVTTVMRTHAAQKTNSRRLHHQT